jgi:hypothetical protein
MDLHAMRVPLATDLKTRQGNNTKDARIKNGYAEARTDQSAVRKRPGTIDRKDTGETIAQLMRCWEQQIHVVEDDWFMVYDYSYNLVFMYPMKDTWDAGVTYSFGSIVGYGGVVYYSYSDGNVGNTPGSHAYWGTSEPTEHKWTQTGPSCLGSGDIVHSPFGSALSAMTDFVATLNGSDACTGSGAYVYYVASETTIYYVYMGGPPSAPYTPTGYAYEAI